MSHNLKKVAVTLLSLSEEEKEKLNKELLEQNYKFNEDPIGAIVRAITNVEYKQTKERIEKEKTEQTAFGLTYGEFCERYDENNGFDKRYPNDSLSTKTTNKIPISKKKSISLINSKSKLKD